MFKRLFGVLLGIGSSPRSKTPTNRWPEPPIKTIREELEAGLVSEISHATGHHGFVSVVGELSYQDTLRRLPSSNW